MAQAKRSGKHVGRPARRKFHTDEIGKMRLLRSQGISIRKLAMDFAVDGGKVDIPVSHRYPPGLSVSVNSKDDGTDLTLPLRSWSHWVNLWMCLFGVASISRAVQQEARPQTHRMR